VSFRRHVHVLAIITDLCVVLDPLSREGDVIRGQALPASPKFQVDPFWPKPLPDDWVTGNVGGTCVDSNDHVFIVNRTADPTNLTNQEKEVGKPAPSVIEFERRATLSIRGTIRKWSPAGFTTVTSITKAICG